MGSSTISSRGSCRSAAESTRRCFMPCEYASTSSSARSSRPCSSSSRSPRWRMWSWLQSVDPAHERQELASGQLVVEVGPVGDVAHASSTFDGVCDDVDVVDVNGAPRGNQHPGQHADGGGLPGTSWVRRNQRPSRCAPRGQADGAPGRCRSASRHRPYESWVLHCARGADGESTMWSRGDGFMGPPGWCRWK